jgi:hypothetical protein
MQDQRTDRILEAAAEVTPEILQAVEDTLDWFDGEPLRTEEFIDRLCETYRDGWDIESYDTPAVRKIMRHARAARTGT